MTEEDPRDDSAPRYFTKRGSCPGSDEFEACVDQIPVLFTAPAFSVNRTLNSSEGNI